MLSILIPVYNFNVVKLVTDLHLQASESFIEFEILVYEDGSTLFTKENSKIKKIEHCLYKILPKNIGRSAIRNLLAREARYEHLIFLDCDAEICHDYFISKYISFFNDKTVVSGGRVYPKNYKDSESLIVAYGQGRERNNPKDIKKKRKTFTTPNFLIPKHIFNEIQFEEQITSYGHEDTLFGIELQRKGYDFIPIDNPVVHIGLEENSIFLEKSESALRNLYDSYKSGQYPELKKMSKLLTTYEALDKLKLTGLAAYFYKILSPTLKQNLYGKSPSLLLFDLYKIGYLCHRNNNK